MTARAPVYRHKAWWHVCAALLLAALACIGPRAMAASWHDEVPNAQMIGQGDMRWLGFNLYTAQLWSAEPQVDTRKPFALVLNYHRRISREQLVDASIKEMQRIGDISVDDQRLARWRGYMMQAFRDVGDGDQLIGVYLPGTGGRFYQRDALLATIDDAEFARAFFDIWLSPQAREPDLRRQLLGGAS
ncbi:hypothetical protein FXN63_00155 [Pigmentiphaga aceris]|uniref:Chalcone isomerase domain-containing protein n=1 Tax=Pigmentiphaga aceris TaxID=1940612 RepID=A0A5C0AS75_9BURK|nr:chalcone isomerase family protein [Pigmentiphaga aceris]QEI04424.1 hypothetical protein FXN63_00155 [Pigmentiphaga aceris]